MPLTDSGFLPEIDYTARDFEAIRAALVRHLQNFFPNDWQDFTESNLGTAIMELVAYVGDQLSFYLDRVANEMFLPTATTRESAIRLTALLGFVPRTTAAAIAPLGAILEAQTVTTTLAAYTEITDQNGNPWQLLENVDIPAGRTSTTNIAVMGEILGQADGGTSFSFITDNDNLQTSSPVTVSFVVATVQYNVQADLDGTLDMPLGAAGFVDFSTGEVDLSFRAGDVPDSGTDITITYTYNQRIDIYQGQTRREPFSSDGTPNQEFTVPNTPVLLNSLVTDEAVFPDPNRFEVWEGDPGAPFGNATGTLWRRVETLTAAGPTEQVYSLRSDSQGRVIVEFGDNVNGAIPPLGSSNFNVIFRIGGGAIGNIEIGAIDTAITGRAGLLGVTIPVTNVDRGSGGAERESLDEIRINAPAFFRTKDTATTEQDYDSLALFSQAGQGAVTRAKSRLTPSELITIKTIHTAVALGQVPAGTPLEYFFLLPATPAIVDSILFEYTVGGVLFQATASDVGGGLAALVDGSGNVDTVSTRLRFDEQEITQETPPGGTADGSTFDFTLGLANFPIFPTSVIFRYTIGGMNKVGVDDGAGVLVGDDLNSLLSTVNYETGVVRLVFGTRASLTSGNSETYDLDSLNGGGPVDLDITLDGAGPTTITFVSGDFVSYSAATALEVAAKINATLAGLASDVGGQVVLTSSTVGLSSSVQITAAAGNPDANAELGFSLSTATGTETPPDNATVISFDYMSAFHLEFFVPPDAGTELTLTMESGPTLTEFPTNNVEVYTWSTGPDGELTTPGLALRDSLKSELDKRRVLGVSIEILPGKIVRVNYTLEVVFDTAVAQSETEARIIAAMEDFFSDVVNVQAGNNVALAAIYDSIFPLQGIDFNGGVTIEDVRIRVPIAEGNGATAIFKTDASTPGRFVSEGKLKGVAGLGLVKVFQDATQIGTSGPNAPLANLSSVTGAPTAVLGGSTFNVETGEFDIRVSPALPVSSVLAVEYSLDEQDGGVKLWNIDVEKFEIAVLGEVIINGNLVRSVS